MNHDPLIHELKKAHELACQFKGGYSARFMSAEEFSDALGLAIGELEAGNTSVLGQLNLWFLPTSDWDGFVKVDGVELGQKLSDMLRSRISVSDTLHPLSPADLHWTESNIESIKTVDRDIEVVASGVFILRNRDTRARRIKVTFKGVRWSRRTVTEYVGGPQAPSGFKEPYIVEDVAPGAGEGRVSLFGLEGITAFQPVAWLDWELEAETGEVCVL